MNLEFEKITSLVGNYTDHFKKEIQVSTDIRNCCPRSTITFPFVNGFNDSIVVHVIWLHNGRFLLTDTGYVISCLKNTGVDLGMSSELWGIIHNIARFHSVWIKTDDVVDHDCGTDFKGIHNCEMHQICITATENKFPKALNNMLQTMLKIDTAFLLDERKLVMKGL